MKSFIVVGAGILGASAAYHIAKKGADVTLIDRGERGRATDAAAGIVCPWLSRTGTRHGTSLQKAVRRTMPI